MHLVNVWTEPGEGTVGFNPMTASLLWLPADYAIGSAKPAFVFLSRWGGYPYDPLATQLGPQLADQGYGCLSLSLRRRGMEGQLSALPDNDLQDIKLAIDYLATNGFTQIYLVGEELGGVSALRYVARRKDPRVRGVCWIAPVASPADWLATAIGEAEYGSAIQRAGIASRQGAGMDVRLDFVTSGLTVTQNAMAFLSWWGPAADTRIEQFAPDVMIPVLVVGEDEDGSAQYADIFRQVEGAAVEPTAYAVQLADWAKAAGAQLLADPPMEMVSIASAEREFVGLLWSPADAQPVRTATLLVHGLTSSPFSPLFLKMAPVLAQSGTAVLAVELRRSGWAGHETSVLDNDLEDIEAWVQYLLTRGYDRIVLAGASIGSISVGRYQSLRQHPNVVAIAHLMPTADCPDWFRAAAQEGPYCAAVEQAQTAVANGLGDAELIDIDIRQPPPNRYGGRFRWTQRAASWLSWWGPDADSRNSAHIANASVPLLLLSGTEDSYNDVARFAELKARAVNAPSVDEIWYPDIDHGLAGVEAQVASDLYAWMRKVAVV